MHKNAFDGRMTDMESWGWTHFATTPTSSHNYPYGQLYKVSANKAFNITGLSE